MPDPHRDRRLWLFNSADFSGNPKWLFVYVTKYRPDIEAHWITDSRETAARIRRLGYSALTFRGERSARLQRRAGVFVVNQVKERIPDAMRGIVLLNLWHGVGVKRVERAMTHGVLLPRIAAKYIRNNKAYRDTQLFLVTSATMETHFREQIGFDESQLIRAGYPQNVYRRVGGGVSTFDHDVRRAKGLSSDARVLMYAPTYRLSGNDGFMVRALPEFNRLAEALEENDQLLILKMHPQLLVDRTYRTLLERYANHPRFLFWDNSLDVYEIFDQIDTAIIDYSSIHYDLIAAGVTRFVRYAFDLGEPDALEPGLDYLGSSCGTLTRNFDELVVALGQDNTAAAGDLERLKQTFWSYDDDSTFERIIGHALSYRVQDVDLPTLYSFDIFDTLVHRRGVRPQAIFMAIAQRMAESDSFPTSLTRRFVLVRGEAEAALREGRRMTPAFAATFEFEITLDSIYARIRELFGLTEELAQTLRGWEIELELETCFADEESVARVKRLVEGGERVILISDMYLPADVVRSILRNADPVLAELPLYLSSEHGVQKATNQLYVRAFVEERYDFGEWVHTGDNLLADVRRPQELGISTMPVESSDLDSYEAAMAASIPTYDGQLLAGMIRDVRRSDVSSAELFAYRIASLYLVPYVLWAVQDAVTRGYDTLYFISRDGHHLRRIADVCIEKLGLPLRTRYIYGSRRAWRLASQLDGIDDDTFAPHGSFGGVRTFAGLIEASRLDEDELLGLFPEFERHRRRGRLTGFEAGQVVEKLRASSAYRARLAEIAIEDRELGVAYLQQEIDFTERSAFVEYWGRGYTQDCLVRLVEQAAEGHREVPFYYARSIYPTRGASARHNYTSSAHSLLLVEALFANLPYGTTEGYVQGEKAIEPRLSVRQHDEELRLAIEEMTPRFALDLLDLPLLDRDALTRDAFRFGFEHFRRQPTFPDYMEHIAHLHDSVELGGIEREFAPSFGVKDFIDYLRGRPLGEITRSLPMTLQRSRGLGPRLLTLQREVGFRRVAKRLTARVFDSFGRGGSRSTDDMVTSNPPIPMSPETTHLTSVPSEVSGSSGEPVATPVGGALSR